MKTLFTSLIIFLAIFLNLESNQAQVETFIEDECYNFHRHNAVWLGYDHLNMNLMSGYAYKGGADASDQPEFSGLVNFSLTDQNRIPERIWENNYYGIDNCNQVLYTLTDNAENEQARAEVKFIRAYNYFHLVRLFGGVPLKLDDCGILAATSVRATEEEVYAQIESDLTESIPYLPYKSELTEENNYKATKGAAQAVLANVYIYQEKWALAESLLNEIIISGEYSLLATFDDLWLEENEHNDESIFEYEFRGDMNFTWLNFSNWISPESNLAIILTGPRELMVENDSLYNGGWGFLQIKEDLVNAFLDNSDTVRMLGTILFLDSLAANGTEITETFESTGYKSNKYTTRIANANGTVHQLNYGQNIVKLRYAEILLLAAEALVNQGKITEAIAYINQVRTRAGLEELGSGLTVTEVLECIYTERTLELALEGKRYHDIVRWGKAEEEFGDLGYDPLCEGKWPIPASVIDFYPSITQNVGYDNSDETLAENFEKIENDYIPTIEFPWIKIPSEIYQPDSLLVYKYNDCFNDSSLKYRLDYLYNEDNLMTSCTQKYCLSDGSTINNYSEHYQYNENNKIAKITKLKYNTDVWDSSSVQYISYQGDSIITDSMGMFYNNDNELNEFIVETYKWNSSLNTYTQEHNLWWDNEDWYTSDKYYYLHQNSLTYNAFSTIEKIKTSAWSEETELWTNYSTLDYSFVNNLVSEIIYSIYTLDELSVSSIESLEYQDDELISYKLYETGGNDLLLSNCNTYSYTNSSIQSIITCNTLNYSVLTEDLKMENTKRFYYGALEKANSTTNPKIEGLDFTVSPNPNDGTFTVSGNFEGSKSLSLYSIYGKKVFEQDLSDSNSMVVTNNLKSGVYILKIDNTAKRILIK